MSVEEEEDEEKKITTKAACRCLLSPHRLASESMTWWVCFRMLNYQEWLIEQFICYYSLNACNNSGFSSGGDVSATQSFTGTTTFQFSVGEIFRKSFVDVRVRTSSATKRSEVMAPFFRPVTREKSGVSILFQVLLLVSNRMDERSSLYYTPSFSIVLCRLWG